MSTLAATLDAVSALWAEAMWRAVWQSTVLAGVILCITWWLRRAPAGLRFWLWMLIPMRLLIMPVVTCSLPVLPPAPASDSQGLHAAALLPEIAGGAPVSAATYSTGSAANLWRGLMVLWLLGVVVSAVRLARSWICMRRLARYATEPSDAAILDIATRAARQVGLRRAPAVLITHQDGSPLTLGIVRPRVILPADLLAGPEEQVQAMLAHECAHVKRRDLLAGWMLAVCEVLYFFHPLVYLAKVQALLERERACDEYVVATGGRQRSAYARALVAIATSAGTNHWTMPATAAMGESFRHLQTRLAAICSGAPVRAHPSRWTAVLMAGMTLICAPGVTITSRSVPAGTERGVAVRSPGEAGAAPVTASLPGEHKAAEGHAQYAEAANASPEMPEWLVAKIGEIRGKVRRAVPCELGTAIRFSLGKEEAVRLVCGRNAYGLREVLVCYSETYLYQYQVWESGRVSGGGKALSAGRYLTVNRSDTMEDPTGKWPALPDSPGTTPIPIQVNVTWEMVADGVSVHFQIITDPSQIAQNVSMRTGVPMSPVDILRLGAVRRRQ